jgi:L-ascorbate metabolism protein UlaG (beta-lactamase superfamily)
LGRPRAVIGRIQDNEKPLQAQGLFFFFRVKMFVKLLHFCYNTRMIITYFGKQFFKIQQGDTVVAINPISKDSKNFNKTKFGSNVVISTTNHPDFNGIESASFGDATPFVINGPGEYEVGDVFVRGFISSAEIDKKKYINTIYLIKIEDINICFLGPLDSKDSLSKDLGEEIDEPDIIFVPINGESTIDAVTAVKIANSFNAKMVIPMDYDAGNIKTFIKETSSEDVKPAEKLTLKKKDFTGGKITVALLDF